MERLDTTSFSTLPDHMVEVILANLSLVELSRIFTTCRSFYGAYRRRNAAEQKLLSDLAEESWGHARIACVITLIAHFLQGKRFHPEYANSPVVNYFISAAGVLYRTGVPPKLLEDILVVFREQKAWEPPPFFCNQIFIQARGRLPANLEVDLWRNRRGVRIKVVPQIPGDLGGVALMQGLLSCGLGQALRDAGQYARVDISRGIGLATQAMLEELVAPLLPFASRRRCTNEMAEMRIGQFESRNMGIGSELDPRGVPVVEDAMIWPPAWEGRAKRLFCRCRSLVGRLNCAGRSPG
jgi:hypothetical protein